MTRPTTPSPTQTPKRRYGRGSVDQLPSGRWRVRVTLHDGSRSITTHDTEKAAEDFRATLVVEREAAAARDRAATTPAPTLPTLATWGETWLKQRRDQKLVRWPAEDEKRWRLHVAPSELASIPLVDLRPRHVRAWVTGLLNRKHRGTLIATQTIRRALALVRKALADAAETEVIPSNPAAGVKVPKRTGKAEGEAWTYLTADEVRAVETCEAMPEASRLLFLIALRTGLRAGELWSLRWADVHTSGGRVEVIVRRSHTSAPKNGKVQSVPLLPPAARAFDRLRELARGDDGAEVSPDALVFPAPRGGQRLRGDDAGWNTRKVRGVLHVGLRERAGITRRVRFHDLRHTAASHLLMGTWGVRLTLAEVRTWLRHGSVTMTERYAHLAPGHLGERVAALTPPSAPSTAPREPAEDAGREVVASTPADARTTPSESTAAREHRSTRRGVTNVGHETPSKIGHAEAPVFTKPLVSRGGPCGGRTHDQRIKSPLLYLENPGEFAGRDQFVTHLPEAALAFLRAVDEGLPAGERARSLALDVLRACAPESPSWALAVAVLEGGALRLRRAVELAGEVIEAFGEESDGVCLSSRASSRAR